MKKGQTKKSAAKKTSAKKSAAVKKSAAKSAVKKSSGSGPAAKSKVAKKRAAKRNVAKSAKTTPSHKPTRLPNEVALDLPTDSVPPGITPETLADRRERALGKRKGVLVTNTSNVRYLTGFTGDSTVLLMWRNGTRRHERLVSDGRFATQLAEQCPEIEAIIREPKVSLPEAIARVVVQAGERFEFEPSAMQVGTFTLLKKQVAEAAKTGSKSGRASLRAAKAGFVEPLRMVKDDHEIAAIRRAVRASEEVFRHMRSLLTPDITEAELAAEGEYFARKQGLTGWSFPAIVAGGDRAALPHYEPGHEPIGKASHVLIDWGVREPGGYVSDLTRTLLRKKREGDVFIAYLAVYRAIKVALDTLGPGLRCESVDEQARDILRLTDHDTYFTHSLGHGIGLDVHEQPGLRPGSTTELQPGMVVTVEPGVYLPGVGGVRLEEDVLITESGAEPLSGLPLRFEEMQLDW